MTTIQTDAAERLMKRCQVGVGGRNAIDEAHDIMAECYGTLGSLVQERDRLLDALENARLLAAKHRREEWAQHILRFCSEAGVTGNVMRSETCPHGRTVGNLCGDCKYGVAEHVMVPL